MWMVGKSMKEILLLASMLLTTLLATLAIMMAPVPYITKCYTILLVKFAHKQIWLVRLFEMENDQAD